MSETIVFKEIKVELPELRTWLGGKEVFPSLNELKLMLVFLSDPYRCFPKDELIGRLGLTDERSLHTLVYNVRRRLNQKYIYAMRGWGYAFALDGRN